MVHLRNCVLCGASYNYCPRCDETEPTYKLKYCSQNCNDISLVLNKYAFKHLTQEEAAMELLKLNVELDKYNDHNQEYIKNILDVMKKPEPKVEVQPVDEPVVEPAVEEVPVKASRKPSSRRK